MSARDSQVSTVSLACRCGRLRGMATHVSPRNGLYVVCHCVDCVTFLRFLGRDDLLEPGRGVHIFQTAPAWVELREGRSELRALRLSPKGLHRWYADCCRTPVGNTRPPLPFVGLSTAFLAPAADGRALEEVIGTPRAHVNGKSAPGGAPANVHPGVPASLVPAAVSRLATWWLVARSAPSPFHRAPAGATRVLTLAEREALQRSGPRAPASPGIVAP